MVFENRPDFEVLCFLVGSVRQYVPGAYGWFNDIITGHVLQSNGLSGRRNVLGIDLLECFEMFQDIGKLFAEFIDIIIGDAHAGKQGNMQDFFAAQFHKSSSGITDMLMSDYIIRIRESARKQHGILEGMNSPRLVFAIVSTIIEELLIVIIAVWGLPQLGINVPFWIIPIVMVVWLAYSVYTYKKGTRALKTGHIIGFPNMIGTTGTATSRLNPEGMVKIRGELWSATSIAGPIEPGSSIIVKGQQRLKLEVDTVKPEDFPGS